MDNVIDLSCREHLASGIISSELATEIKGKLQAIKEGKEVDGVTLTNYSSATKILLVHYAVDVAKVKGTDLQNLILPHDCYGLDRLIDELQPDLDLVIHGHLHTPKIYTQNGVPVVAISTTTQRNSKGENGFFVLKFYKSGEARAEHHRWLVRAFCVTIGPDLTKFSTDPRRMLLQLVKPIARSMSSREFI